LSLLWTFGIYLLKLFNRGRRDRDHMVVGFITTCAISTYPVFTLNFLPGGPVSSNTYRPTINSTGPNLKTTLMTIND
jgi:hypothetical protein